MRALLAGFFRRCASLVGIPAIHARLDKVEKDSARKVDLEGLQRSINILESRMLEMNTALMDYVDERTSDGSSGRANETTNVSSDRA